MPAKIATSIQHIPELLGWLRVTAPVTWLVLRAYLDTSAFRAWQPLFDGGAVGTEGPATRPARAP